MKTKLDNVQDLLAQLDRAIKQALEEAHSQGFDEGYIQCLDNNDLIEENGR